MSTNDLTRCCRFETIPDVTDVARRKQELRRLLMRGVMPLILGPTLAGANPGVGLGSGALDEPPERRANLNQSPYDVSRPDGDSELKLLEELKAADDAYADHFDPAQLDNDLAAAFRRYGLDLDRLDPKLAAERLGRRASTSVLAAELDRWCHICRTRLNAPIWRRLNEVARATDPEPWRNTLRDQNDRPPAEALAALRTLAASAEALEKQPAASLLTLAVMIEDAGDRSTATSVLRLASRRFESNFWVWFELGRMCLSGAENAGAPEAAQSFAKAAALRPRSLAAHTSLGTALANQGKIEEATVEFLEAERIKKDSNNHVTDLKQLDQTLTKAEKTLGNEPAQFFDRSELGQAAPDKEALAEVFVPTPKSSPPAPQTAAGFYNRGIKYAQHKEYSKAISDFDKVIKLDPKFASAYVVRGEIWLMRKEFDHAIADYDAALRLERQSSAYRGRGFAWLGKRNLTAAIDDFNEAVRLAPEDARSYYGRGYAWSAKKEFEKAKLDFDDAIRCDALFAAAYVARGHAWTSQKEHDKAIADFDDAVRLEPSGASAYTGRGYAWAQKRDYEKALAEYETAIRLDPEDAGALNGCAWLWSTCPDGKYRNGKNAGETARKACELTDWKDAMIVDTLAAACAETGDFDSAVKWQTKAIEALTDDKERDDFRARLVLYQQKKPYRQPAMD
jgi:tetratricopeptide (TPR) repeat protein